MSKFFKIGDCVKRKEWDSYLPIVDIRFHEIRLQEGGAFAWYNTAFHNFEKEEPMKIEMDKKYRQVGTHEPVRIICTDRVTYNNQFPVVALIAGADGREDFWALDDVGVSASGNKIIEEIPQTDWSKVQVDTLIWVRGTPRYFHAYSAQDDFVCFYKDGATSVTNTNGISWVCSEDCSLEKPNA